MRTETVKPKSTQPKKSAKNISNKEEQQLFEVLNDALSAVEDAEQAFKNADEACQAALKEVQDKMGSGPYSWHGKMITIAHRGGRYFTREVDPKKLRVIGR